MSLFFSHEFVYLHGCSRLDILKSSKVLDLFQVIEIIFACMHIHVFFHPHTHVSMIYRPNIPKFDIHFRNYALLIYNKCDYITIKV